MRNLFLIFTLFTSLLFGRVEFLMPEDAFKPSITLNGDTIEIQIALAKGIYIYADKLEAVLIKSENIIIKNTESLPPVDHGEEKVFLSSPDMKIYLSKKADYNDLEDIELKLTYQGCSDAGLCYEPMEHIYKFSIDSSKLSSDEPKLVVQEESETDTIANTLKEGSLFLIILTFFGFGLLLSLTPCIFPMIPIISSVIVAQGKNITTKRAFFLSLVYVLAMSVAYTIAGILAGLFGANLQAAFQAPWIIGTFSAIFVILAFSMFGMFELQMPVFIQSRLTKMSSQKGGVLGVAIMGFLSALIVGPCVAAPLAGALIYIGQSGDAILGGIALFALSLGMGVPLLVVGTGAGRFMPQPGSWMDAIKDIFGVLLLAISIWMLSRVVPSTITMYLGSALLIFSAIRIGQCDHVCQELQKSLFAAIKAIALILLMYGIALFLGALTGASNIFNPLEKLVANHESSVNVQYSKLRFIKVDDISKLESVLKQNRDKKIMIDFYADWCTSCQEYEHITFNDSKVISRLSDFVLIKADVTANGEDQKALSKKFGVFGPPVMIFLDKDHNRIKRADLVGYKSPSEFLSHLKKIKD